MFSYKVTFYWIVIICDSSSHRFVVQMDVARRASYGRPLCIECDAIWQNEASPPYVV